MDFLDANGVFDLEKLDARDYPLFSGEFEETVDVPLLKLIIKDTTKVMEYIPENFDTNDIHIAVNNINKLNGIRCYYDGNQIKLKLKELK